jgi:hypothetical protein
LSSDNGGGFLTAPTDQINTDPLLGPLQDNGGPTFTHALLPGSPAIDKGKNFSGATTDQRGPGFVRTFDDVSTANATGGDGTDIGAFEVQCTEFPPVITLKAAAVLKPFNHSYRTFTIAQMVRPILVTVTPSTTSSSPPIANQCNYGPSATGPRMDASIW